MKNRTIAVALATLLGGISIAVLAPAQGQTNGSKSEQELRARVRLLEQQVRSLLGLQGQNPSPGQVNALGGLPNPQAGVVGAPPKKFSLPQGFTIKNIPSSSFPQAFSAGIPKAGNTPLPPNGDIDQDGLTNAEEQQLGTDPYQPDTDGDGLLDGWEIHKIDGIDLRARGASPLHKDIFVEMDYMVRPTATFGLAPSPDDIQKIQEVFANAPILNKDGGMGINLHLELDKQVPYDDLLDPYIAEFTAIRQANFNPQKARFYHYMVWANAYKYSGETTSSGISLGIQASDFIVTLGTWNNKLGGTPNQKIGTFIHELGHNLGLRHGSLDDVNFKPNHLSVMNYAFQTTGVIFNESIKFDYQRFNLPSLMETNLVETNGMGNPNDLFGYRTKIRRNTIVDAWGAIDWNLNGTIQVSPINLDINGDGYAQELLATTNEWNALFYTGGSIGKLTNTGLLEQETISQYKQLPFIELTEKLASEVASPQS